MKEHTIVALALAALVAASAGCSVIVDGAIQDRDASVNDSPCAAFPDGTACTIDGIAEDLVCIEGLCEVSSCGDGVVDDRTEACDDANDVSNDGCEIDCELSCGDDPDCDDGNVCNGEETCSDANVCTPGTTAADGTDCGGGATCASGVCIPAGCGNGVLDTGEECDPGISDDGSCRSDCTWTCESDEECALMDTTVCDGIDTCDVGSHQCVGGTPLDCVDDGNACTIESCDPAVGCVRDTTTNDADGDGHYATSCGGDDCDDARSNVHPGLGDACGDGLDNDCNGTVDDGTPVWYVDCDGDGYASGTTGSMTSCTVPPARPSSCASGTPGQWTSRQPIRDDVDCQDGNASVRPGQASWFTSAYTHSRGTSFDYDCSGVPEYQYNTLPPGALAFCSGSLGSCFGTQYLTGTTAPSCGQSRTLSYCGGASCTRTTRTVTVACH